MRTKGDIVNAAFSRARISGLTKLPTPSDLDLAMDRLEDMAAMWQEHNLCANYNFEDRPDTGSPHNVGRGHLTAFKANLAIAILADFGKQPHPNLIAEAAGALSNLYSSTATLKQIAPSRRQPRGSGNTLRANRWQRFYRPPADAPTDCEVEKMFVGDIQTFTEFYDSFLGLNEIISSFTISSDSGINIQSSSNTDETVSYTVLAEDPDGTDNTEVYRVKIAVTTNEGRKLTRFINFEIIPSEL